ncbi:MAG: rod shape-determining protein MreD [Limisphaerales bacterium]
MNWLRTTAIMIVAFLAVFLEAVVNGPRQWLGAQIDLLPALTVYTALKAGPASLALLAVGGGLWFDSLSANPLGLSILPLFVVGFLVLRNHDLVLRDQPYAQFVLGLMASAAVPALTVVLLTTLGEQPLVGWGSLWQWTVLALGGGALTPPVFYLFDRLQRAFSYPVEVQSSFRPDRETKRGRSL